MERWERRGSKRSFVVSGGEMAQAVRLERPGFTSCRGGEGGGWLGNNHKAVREVPVCWLWGTQWLW